MDYEKWEPLYKKIMKDFNFSVENDIKAANILNQLFKNKNISSHINKLKNLINNKKVIIFGAGPSLETSILKYKKRLTDYLKIAADGTTTFLLKNGIVPEIIVTDLDGRVSDQLKANSEGSIIIIHAHGDNIKKIKNYFTEFKGELIGTIQVNPEPYDALHNLGGFTDGDRAIYLANHFNANKIYLMGFDFNNKIGKYSFMQNKNRSLKLKKLKWCKYLINLVNKQKSIFYL